MSTAAFATTSSTSQELSRSEIPALVDQPFTQEQSLQIQSEIITLNNCLIDTSIIEKINMTPNGNEYILNYNDIEEKVSIQKNSSESVTIIANAGDICNVISFENDGSIMVDGYKVQTSKVEDNSNTLTRGVVWKSVKSLSPSGSLQPSDYNKYLTSSTQNVALGKALNNYTVTALSAFIGTFNAYIGITVSLATVAKAIYDVLVEVNPKTQYLGCVSTTYTCGASDYKYINKFYSNKECTGSYKQKLSYEHFTVY